MNNNYKIVITRFFNFDYYQSYFLRFYSRIADKIFIWTDVVDYKLVKNQFFNYEKVKVLCWPSKYFIDYQTEVQQINYIFQITLTIAETLLSKYKSIIIIFADEDEIIELPQQLKLADINFTVFYEWYLPENVYLNFEKFVKTYRKFNGKILEAWGDVFYKTNVILVNKSNIKLFRRSWFTSGFHRIIFDHKILGNKNNYLIANHFKGLPLLLYKKKIQLTLKKARDRNDWIYIHYKREIEKIRNYNKFYKTLKDYGTLKKDLRNMILKSKKYSYFDEVIVKGNIKNPAYGHKPQKIKLI